MVQALLSFLKRMANGSSGWDEVVSDRIMGLMDELMRRLDDENPVKGVWAVPNSRIGRVWCDESSLAVGVCLEINRHIVEDGCWLRREDDVSQMNLITDKSRLRTNGMGEALIRRWLGLS